jgi:hypothetical protein
MEAVLRRDDTVVYVCEACDPGVADRIVAADIAAWKRERGETP